MKRTRSAAGLLVLTAAVMVSGCAHMPGGIAASTTPIEGRSYRNLGPARATDSAIYLLGILPMTGSNSTRESIDRACRTHGGDAMINVTVEAYSQYWILFSRYTTRVEGDVIRFE